MGSDRRRRPRWQVAAGALAAGLVAVGLLGGDDSPQVPPTDAILFFDDSYDGLTIVDVDGHIAVRHSGVGQAAGDQPFRLARVADRLIVGSGEIYAAPLGVGPSRRIGEGTIFLPAAEPDRVWLIDYPGGTLGAGRPQVRSVDTTGRVLLDVPGPETTVGGPAIGVPGGLGIASGSGLDLWDAATGEVTGHLGIGSPLALDVAGSTLAWCDDGCKAIRLTDLTDLGDGDRQTMSVDLDGPGSIVTAKLAPDGRHVAVTVAEGTPRHPGSVVIVDTATGDRTTVPYHAGVTSVAWSPDGQELFLANSSHGTVETDLGRYSLSSGSLERTTLPFGGLLDFVVADRSDTGPLPPPTMTAEGCPPPTNQPSGRTEDCSFRFDESQQLTTAG